MKQTLYTVSRIRKNDDLYGPIHAADNDTLTICGKKIERNGTWYILTNNFDGKPTCKQCQKFLTEQ